MQRNSKEFKDLQAKWDAKLAKSGFEDAEQRDGHMKRWHSYDMPKRLGTVRFQVQAEYYNAAQNFYSEYEFATETDRKIWELHAAGVSVREIAQQMKKTKVNARSTIQDTITRLRAIMVIRWRE